MSAPVVLGLDFGGTKIAAAVADLEGHRLAEATIATDPARGARWNLEVGLETARGLLGTTNHGAKPLAIGACTFGIPATKEILLATAIPGWGDLALARELADGLGCDAVRLATDVKAAAAAEVRSGALAGADPAIYVNLGTGLAVAIVCGGDVVVGANGAAGEIGYSLRRPADLSRHPADRVLLEQVVSGMALEAVARRDTGLGLSAADVFAGESDNDALAAALDEFIEELSFHLVNLSVALNPERIAAGGGMVRSWHRIEPRLRWALDTCVPFPPELVRGAFPYDATLVGAVTLALEQAHELLGERANGGRRRRVVERRDRVGRARRSGTGNGKPVGPDHGDER